MSTHEVNRLLRELAQDLDFDSKIRSLDSIDARISAIVEAGRERGFEVSAADVRSSTSAAVQGGELSEDQLDTVAGGADESVLQMVVRWMTPHNWDTGGGGGGGLRA